MHSVTGRQTDDRMMPIADHTVYQYDQLKRRLRIERRSHVVVSVSSDGRSYFRMGRSRGQVEAEGGELRGFFGRGQRAASPPARGPRWVLLKSQGPWPLEPYPLFRCNWCCHWWNYSIVKMLSNILIYNSCYLLIFSLVFAFWSIYLSLSTVFSNERKQHIIVRSNLGEFYDQSFSTDCSTEAVVCYLRLYSCCRAQLFWNT